MIRIIHFICRIALLWTIPILIWYSKGMADRGNPSMQRTWGQCIAEIWTWYWKA